MSHFLFGFGFGWRFTDEMNAVESRTLLEAYARDGSETAFRKLVERYIDLVHSTALRLAEDDRGLAQDIVQTVFIDLARKAADLSPRVLLGGWLHRRTCHVAATMLRSERRRRAREKHVMDSQTQPDHTQANLARVAPVLDEAIERLDAQDRAAIILRFFEQREFRAVGAALDTSEDGARMRVSRALEKLRVYLSGRGVTLSATGLGSALTLEAVTSAPAGLASTVAAAALSSAAAGAGGTATFIRILSLTKAKALMVALITVAVLTALFVIQWQAQGNLVQARLRQENEALRHQLQEVQQPPRSDLNAAELERSRQGQTDLLRLRAEVTRLHQQLQTVSNQLAQAAMTALEPTTPREVLSGFRALRANVHTLMASGQALFMGGWPGRPGSRLVIMAIPNTSAEDANKVDVELTALEMPERVLGQVGLGGLVTDSPQSPLVAALPSERVKELRAAGDELVKQWSEAGQPAIELEHYNWLGLGTLTATNGRATSWDRAVAIYDDTWCGFGIPAGSFGETTWIHREDRQIDMDLGPYSGPPITVLPVILTDRTSLDMTFQATLYKRFGESN